MTVRELEGRMGGNELLEWIAFDRLEPLPDPYWQAGIVAATVANALGSGRRRYRPEDFMPRTREPRRVQSAAEGLARFDALTRKG